MSRLLQPLLVPQQAWQIVSLDIIEGLLKFKGLKFSKKKGFDAILMVIDKFTKYGHSLPLSHPYTTMSVAQLYLNQVYKLHDLPQMLISSRDSVFTSALW